MGAVRGGEGTDARSAWCSAAWRSLACSMVLLGPNATRVILVLIMAAGTKFVSVRAAARILRGAAPPLAAFPPLHLAVVKELCLLRHCIVIADGGALASPLFRVGHDMGWGCCPATVKVPSRSRLGSNMTWAEGACLHRQLVYRRLCHCSCSWHCHCLVELDLTQALGACLRSMKPNPSEVNGPSWGRFQRCGV